MMIFEPSRLISQHGETGGVALGEGISAEAAQLRKDRRRDFFIHAIFQRPFHEDHLQLIEQLKRILTAQGAAQHLPLPVAEAGDIVRHLQHLLLPKDDAQGLFQRRLEPLIEIAHFFDAAPPPQVGMDHIAHDGTGADQADGDDQIEEARWFQARQGVHLGAALALEDAEGLGFGDHLIDARVIEEGCFRRRCPPARPFR